MHFAKDKKRRKKYFMAMNNKNKTIRKEGKQYYMIKKYPKQYEKEK